MSLFRRTPAPCFSRPPYSLPAIVQQKPIVTSALQELLGRLGILPIGLLPGPPLRLLAIATAIAPIQPLARTIPAHRRTTLLPTAPPQPPLIRHLLNR